MGSDGVFGRVRIGGFTRLSVTAALAAAILVALGCATSAGAEVLPTAVTGAASEVTATSAKFEGSVNPNGEMVYYEYFEVGLDTKYEGFQAWGETSWVTGSADYPVVAHDYWLEPNRAYHYRLVAVGTNGNGYGEDRTFSTPAAPPAVAGGPAAPVEGETATLHGSVNPENSPTGYRFEYGTTSGYGASTPEVSAGEGYGSQEVSAEIAGLAPDTVYHYRIAADNGVEGTQYGPDDTFRTPPASAPSVSGVTGVSATLEGSGDVLGSGTYHYEYGTDTSYGLQTPVMTGEPVSGDQVLATQVKGLAPSTTYHFRLIVTTATRNVSIGPDGTFTTWPAPTVATGEANGVGAESAVLHGTVDTHRHPGGYRFVIVGVGSSVYRTTPEQPVSSEGPLEVSAPVGGLPDGGEYRVVLLATVGGLESYGQPTTFATSSLATVLPRVLTSGGNPYAGLPSGTVASVPPAAPVATLAIVSVAARGAVATIVVDTPGPGGLSVSGRYLRATVASASGAGVRRLTVRLSKAGVRRLRHAGKLRAAFTVTFTPPHAKPAVVRGTVAFKRKGARK